MYYFPKKLGDQMHYWPPIPFLGGHGPLAPVADPMLGAITVNFNLT